MTIDSNPAADRGRPNGKLLWTPPVKSCLSTVAVCHCRIMRSLLEVSEALAE